MLQGFRDKIQGGLAKVIIVLICIPFAFFGIESFFQGGSKSEVAEVGGVAITESELNEAMFLRKRQLLNKMGENIDYSLLEDTQLRRPALTQLIDTQVLLNGAKQLGLDVAYAQVDDQIINDPSFQIDGKFSNEKFNLVVQQAGLSLEVYRRLIKDEFLIQQLYSGFMGAEFITENDLKAYGKLINETRDIAAIRLSLKEAKKDVSVSEKEITAFYEKNKQNFKSDERFVLAYLTVEKAQFEKPIDEKSLRESYDREVKNFKPKNTYKLSHIEIKNTNPEQAKEKLALIQGKLKKGQAFSDLAKAYSDDLGSKQRGGSIGKGEGNIFPKEFMGAVASLKAGEVTLNAVELDGSLHLIRLDELVIDKPLSFANRRLALTEELVNAQADPLFRNAEETLKDLAFNSVDLKEPAKAINADIKTTAPLTRAEVNQLFNNPQMQQAIFSDEVLLDRQNTDVYEVSDGKLITARVSDHILPEVLPLAQVEKNIQAQLVNQKADEKLSQLMDTLIKEIKTASESPQKIVESIGLEASYKKYLAVKRSDFSKVGRVILDEAFKLPSSTVADQVAYGKVSLPNGDTALLLVNNVQSDNSSPIKAAEKKSLKIILGQSRGNNLFQSYEDYLKKVNKVTYN